MAYTNSPLVTYKNITANKTKNRNHAIDTITIHCIVGQWTAKQGCDYFATTDRQCSANYVVGKDGSIGLSVDEKDRSWCSSSSANDHRAVTIEVASDTKHPYAVTDAAYNALIKLVADICQRNGIKKLLWQADKSLIGQVDKQNMTVHRWFANKSCPGEYLYERHGAIAEAVNKILGADTPETEPEAKEEPATAIKKGDVVTIADNATYYNGKKVPGWVRAKKWIVKENPVGNRAVIDKSTDGENSICSPIDVKYLIAEKPYYPDEGDVVNFTGKKHYTSANATKAKSCKPGKARVTSIHKLGESKHPYHLVAVSGGGSTVYGWVDADTITKL